MDDGFTLRGISFSHSDQPLFCGMSLRLKPGLFHGILGPNGSGKTTLLDLLNGQCRPARGRIHLGDRCIDTFSRREMARKCALVPQDFRVNFPFTVFQVVQMGRYPHVGRFGGLSRDDLGLVDQAMVATDVKALAHRYINELSGGERQRVVFARALAQRAEILILDEATSSLDVKHTLTLMNLVAREVREAGVTVIAVMHDLNLAARYCDALLILKEGGIAAQGPVEEVLTAAVIRAVFEVEAKVYFDDVIKCLQVVYIQ